MKEERWARWLFYECPKCGAAMTIEDKFGAFCPVRDCGWKASGDEAAAFIKEADEAQEGW